MGRYLVTGGAGFIGSHIASALVARGEEVRVFDNFGTGKRANLAHLAGRVELAEGDLRDGAAVMAALRGVEVVFHEGAQVSVPRSVADPMESLRTNVNGTLHVLLAAREAGARRVIFASSCAIYGDSPALPKHEEMLPDPLSPYAADKLAAEHQLRVFARLYGLETVALRYFNVFGPRQDPASEYAAVIPLFLTAMLEGRQPVVFGDGEQTRDFIFIENVVRANLLAAEAPEAAGRAINIGSGEQTSLNALLNTMGALLDRDATPRYDAPRAGDIRASVADISLARRLLAYSPAIGLREGLARTLEALGAS